jgi:hypothetical protein
MSLLPVETWSSDITVGAVYWRLRSWLFPHGNASRLTEGWMAWLVGRTSSGGEIMGHKVERGWRGRVSTVAVVLIRDIARVLFSLCASISNGCETRVT